MSSTPTRYCGESDKDLHQKRFLEAFEVSCSIQKAARWANIHRQTHYDWLRKDATYPARFAEARQQAAQTLEDEAVRRALWRESADRYSTAVNRSTSRVSRYSKSSIRTNF